jgi:hypothetical protein
MRVSYFACWQGPDEFARLGKSGYLGKFRFGTETPAARF